MMKCKKNIPFLIIMFIGSIVLALYAVAYMDATLKKVPLESMNFLFIVRTVLKNKLALKLFEYFSVFIILGFLYLLFCDTKSYQSDQIKITDTISTPVAAGQGQCGTAKWLPKKAYDKAFATYEFNEGVLQEWNKIKLDDIKKELGRIQ